MKKKIRSQVSYTKTLMTLLVLGCPLLSQGATDASITITATVTAECSIVLDKAAVNMGNASAFSSGSYGPQTVKVTTNCGGAPGELTLASSGANGKNLILTHSGTEDKTTLNVGLQVEGQDAKFASGVYKYGVKQNTNVTTLTFSGVAGQKSESLNAGEYKGSLSVKVAPV